jgi:hypothetical protein
LGGLRHSCAGDCHRNAGIAFAEELFRLIMAKLRPVQNIASGIAKQLWSWMVTELELGR